MATATLAFTPDSDAPVWLYRGRQKGKTGVLKPTADDDYAANGLAVTAAIFGMSRLDEVDVHGLWSDGDSATVFEGAYYDKPNGTIQLATGGADGDPFDESNTTALSGYTLRVTAWGA